MYLIKGAASYTDNGFVVKDVVVDGDIFFPKTAVLLSNEQCNVIDAHNLLLVPGFVDVHVHLREPGFFYKENMLSGTTAAASAGYTAICAMPNLNPVPDCYENLAVEQEIIKKNAKVKVYPYGSITIGEKGKKLSDMDALSPYVVAFSDDGCGVQDSLLMYEAMKKAKRLNKAIVAHSEDNALLKGGYIHDGEYARMHGHKGICSKSEWGQLARDLDLVKKTGCQYHICHISTKESVELIRQAKKDGLNVSCETAPHYLVLCDEDIQEDGRFKMNPPIRAKEDKDALVEGLKDGTIDIVATDHAPHSDEEKSRGLKDSLMGVIGLETAFAELYTHLVMTNKISLERLVEVMCIAPRKIFNLEGGKIEVGCKADFALIDLNFAWTVHGKECLSKGNSTPFEGDCVFAKNMYTFIDGEIVWKSQRKN